MAHFQAAAEAMTAEVNAWLDTCADARPGPTQVQQANDLGVPACHVWETPCGALPTHENIRPLELIERWQRDACAVCSMPAAVLDHCHSTGLVRGLLCRGCNVSEGRSYGSPLFVAYRLRPPAVLLGTTELYSSSWTGTASPKAGVSVPDSPAAAARALHREAVIALTTTEDPEGSEIRARLAAMSMDVIGPAIARWTKKETANAPTTPGSST
ncbi:endonuclease domain-containing protein [Streptomyces sp. IBSNAI002]|uniref:endonuclease domain-containing protein n=1 Tax=Streptomyces sp. IBSNAI002 TaxID=3457500 RepID=UPI003FD297F3